MPPRDPNKVQLDFPLLVAELIDQLQLIGAVGLLDFDPRVQPVFLIGSRGIAFATEPTVFNSASTFFGEVSNPVGNQVIVDTGPLAAGTYNLNINMSFAGNNAISPGRMRIQHQNAANNAALAVLASLSTSPNAGVSLSTPVIGYEIGLNERLRVISSGTAFTGAMSATIYARIRPAP